VNYRLTIGARKKNNLSFFSFQLNAKKRFVIFHTVRLWWHSQICLVEKNLNNLIFFAENFLLLFQQGINRFDRNNNHLLKVNKVSNVYCVQFIILMAFSRGAPNYTYNILGYRSPAKKNFVP
jgi:hypothetical protein